MRDAAGEIDHLDAARDLAERIGVGLAVLLRDGAGDVVGVLSSSCLEAEHRRARFSGGVSPQPAAACLAAATAASTSAAVESGSSAVCSPVAGLKTGASAPRGGRDLAAVDGVLDAFAWRVMLLSVRGLQDAGEDVDQLVDLAASR